MLFRLQFPPALSISPLSVVSTYRGSCYKGFLPIILRSSRIVLFAIAHNMVFCCVFILSLPRYPQLSSLFLSFFVTNASCFVVVLMHLIHFDTLFFFLVINSLRQRRILPHISFYIYSMKYKLKARIQYGTLTSCLISGQTWINHQQESLVQTRFHSLF